MTPTKNTLGDRLGAAFAEGAPTGVSLDIARATSTSAQAQQAASFPGAAFGLTQAPTGAAAWQQTQARAAQGGSVPLGPLHVDAPQPGPAGAASNYISHLHRGIPGLASFFMRGGSPVDVANDIGGTVSRVLHSALSREIAGVSAVEVLNSNVAQGIIRTLEWGPEYLANYHEARIRTGRDVLMNGGNPLEAFRQFTGVGTLGMLDLINEDGAMRRNFEKAVDAEASAFQTAYLAVAEQWGGTSSGIEADFDLMLDDPRGRADRDTYFSHGTAHWVTGIGDAIWQVVADPTLIGGKAGAVLKSARSTLRASDVAAAAASRTDDAIKLTRKQTRAVNYVAKLADALADPVNTSRASRTLANSKWLRDSEGGATIAYAAARAKAVALQYQGQGMDVAARDVIEDVLYAGMGHAESLARVDAHSKLLGVEVRRMANMGQPDSGRLAEQATMRGVTINGNPIEDGIAQARVIATARGVLERDPLRRLEKSGLLERAEADVEIFDAVKKFGQLPTRAGGRNAVTYDAGPLARLGSTQAARTARKVRLAAMDDSPLRVVGTKNYGQFVNPLHFVTGRWLPGTFKVSDPYKAAPVFSSAIVEAKRLLSPKKIQVGGGEANRLFVENYSRILDDLEVEFASVPPRAAAKAHRAAVVEKYNGVVDEIIAARTGILNDPDGLAKMRAAHEAMRGRRSAEAEDFYKQVQYAVTDADVAAAKRAVIVDLPDGQRIALDLQDLKKGDNGTWSAPEVDPNLIPDEPPVNMPAIATQERDWVALTDPNDLMLHATREFANGFGGKIARTRTSRGWKATNHLFATANYVWKVAALFRIPAYTIRAMSDTLARNIALLGGLKSLENTLEGTKNLIGNNRRLSASKAAAVNDRMRLHRRLRDLEENRLPLARENYAASGAAYNEALRNAEYWRQVEVDTIAGPVDDQAAAVAELVATPGWQDEVWADPSAWESAVRRYGETDDLVADEITERLSRLARDYEDAVEVRAIHAERAQVRQARLDALDAAADARHTLDEEILRLEHEIALYESTGGTYSRAAPGATPENPGTVEVIPALRQQVADLEAKIPDADARLAEAQADYLDEVDVTEPLSRQATAAALTAAKVSREADRAAEILAAAEADVAAVRSALEALPTDFTPPAIRNQEALDALFAAYRPSEEWLRGLSDTSRPLRIVVAGGDTGDIDSVLETLAELAETYGRDLVIARRPTGAASARALGWAHRRGVRVEELGKKVDDWGDVALTDATYGEVARGSGALTIDSGAPTPETLRRSYVDEAAAIRAELDRSVGETPGAPVRTDPEQVTRARRDLIRTEDQIKAQREALLEAEVAEDAASGKAARRITRGPNKGAIRKPKRPLSADEKRIRKNLRTLMARKAQLEQTLESGRIEFVPVKDGGRLELGRHREAWETEQERLRREAMEAESPGWDEVQDFAEAGEGMTAAKKRGAAERAEDFREEFVSKRRAEREAREAAEVGAKRIRLAELEHQIELLEARSVGDIQADLTQWRAIEAGSTSPAPARSVEDLTRELALAEEFQRTFGRAALPEVPGKAARESLDARLIEARAAAQEWQARLAELNRQHEEAGTLADELAKAHEVALARQARAAKIERLDVGDPSDLSRYKNEQMLRQLEFLADRDRVALQSLEEQFAFGTEAASRKIEALPWRKQRGKTVKVGNTLAARRIGVGEKMSLDGTQYRQGGPRDPYRTIEEWRDKAASFSTDDALLSVLYQGTKADVENLRRTGKWEMMAGGDKRWAGAYTRLVNFHIAKDALARRIVDDLPRDEVVRWMQGSPEGRAYFDSMRESARHSGYEIDLDAVIDRAEALVNSLLPPGSHVRETVRSVGNIVPRDIARESVHGSFKKGGRPEIPFELVEMSESGKKIDRYFSGKARRFSEKYFEIFATMPEERMGRHPLYAARYQQHFDNYMNNGPLKDLDEITTGQYDEARLYADHEARRDMGRFMFDTGDKSNAGYSLGLLSPFYSAWEDSMVKWFRLLGENPEVLPLAWNVARAPNAAGLVHDEDGNPIDVYGHVRDKVTGERLRTVSPLEGYITVPTFGVDLTEWAGVENFRFRKDGANVVFQGDPFWLPGPGPSLTVPANYLVQKSFPELWREETDQATVGSEILRWLLPYGPQGDEGDPGILESALPAWAKTLFNDVVRQDSKRYSQVFNQLYAEQYTKERLGEIEKVSESERMDIVANRTRNWFLMRLLGTQSPVSLSPQSPLAHYRAEYNRLRRENPMEADDLFAKMYPDYFDLNVSMTANETGLFASVEAWSAADTYRREIAREPEFGWFYAGAENLTGTFNQAVYSAQLAQEIDPRVGTTTFRTRLDPLAAAKRARVSEGWDEYHKVMERINLALEDQGIPSLNRKEALPLRELKDRFIQDLKTRNNDWAAEYGSGGAAGSRVTKFLTHALKAYQDHPELQERPDGEALMQYIEMREKIRGIMRQDRQNRNLPGFGSLNASDYDDAADGTPGLRTIWEGFTADLVNQDVGFAQMWNRVLSRDDLSGSTYEGGS